MTAISRDRLESLLRIEGYVELTEPLHIGSGRAVAGESDLPVLLDLQGRPFIPASSLRGVLRAELEAALRGLNEAGNLKLDVRAAGGGYCDVLNGRYCVPKVPQSDERQDQWGSAEHILQHACPVCQLFGAPYLGSVFLLCDLPVLEESWSGASPASRTCAPRDRRTGTAARRRLYDYELLDRGTRFKLLAVLENPRDYDVGLILLLFERLNLGRAGLGGRGSVGLGIVRVELTGLTQFIVRDWMAGCKEATKLNVKSAAETYRQALVTHLGATLVPSAPARPEEPMDLALRMQQLVLEPAIRRQEPAMIQMAGDFAHTIIASGLEPTSMKNLVVFFNQTGSLALLEEYLHHQVSLSKERGRWRYESVGESIITNLQQVRLKTTVDALASAKESWGQLTASSGGQPDFPENVLRPQLERRLVQLYLGYLAKSTFILDPSRSNEERR